MKRILIWMAMLLPLTLSAQKVRTVQAEATYYAELSESVSQAREKALQTAKIQALAQEFGTIVTQSVTQQDISRGDGDESSYFSSLSDTEVKGEWIEDIGEPEFDISFAGDVLVVKCKVKGRAREISNDAAEFKAVVLRNGTQERFADTSFHDGDDLYLLFQAPRDGYVAVYLVDEQNNAFCLLPYMDNESGQHKVRHGKEYVFFSAEKDRKEVVDEYTLTCDLDIEHNRIYVIFSPNSFTKALDSQRSETLPRQTDYESFRKWLGSLRKRDTEMGVKEMQLAIRK